MLLVNWRKKAKSFSVKYKESGYFPAGLPCPQRLPGPDVGAGTGSEGHGQRALEAPLPLQGRPSVLHRPADAAEQDEMKRDTKHLRAVKATQVDQNTPAHGPTAGRSRRSCRGKQMCTSILFIWCESLNCGERAPCIRGNK